MRRYESDCLCENCGYEYGEHRWIDDACPRMPNLPETCLDRFRESSFFEPKKDEGGKE